MMPIGGVVDKKLKSVRHLNPESWTPPWINSPEGILAGVLKPIPRENGEDTSRQDLPTAQQMTWLLMPR
jgi:hypothetical protein